MDIHGDADLTAGAETMDKYGFYNLYHVTGNELMKQGLISRCHDKGKRLKGDDGRDG